ncbi:hypothetical protein V1506DRAFT_549763 [Lipomyces tetrasporus]
MIAHILLPLALVHILLCALVRAVAPGPVLCLVKASPDQYPLVQSPIYWFFTYGSPSLFDYTPYYSNGDIFNGKAASPDGFVVMKLQTPDAQYVPHVPSNDVYAYFYNIVGSPTRTIVFVSYNGYAYHFKSKYEFGGWYDTATYGQLYVIQSSCVAGEYLWPYKRKGKVIPYTSWLRNYDYTGGD